MNPRKVDAPAQNANIADDFASEERVLETPPLELFPLESRHAAAQRTTVLDFEKPVIQPWPPVTTRPTATTVGATRLRPRRSILRLVGTVGVIAVLIAAAAIGGAAVRSRLDVSVLANYLQVVRTRASAVLQLLPQLEVVRDSGSAASATKVTESPPPTVATAERVAAIERPENVDVPVAAPTSRQRTISRPPTRASVPSPRRPAVSSLRAAAAPPPARPVRPVIEHAEASPLPAPAVSASTSSPAVPPTSSAPLAAVTTVPLAPENPAAPLSTPSSPPPRAVVSAPSAAPAGALTSETRAVALALNRYQNAFSALDANAAHAVWPSVDVKALARAFDQLETQTFDLEGCDISVSGARAEADCSGNARYVRKVGNRALRVEPRRWHFTLRQTNDQWIIDAVAAR